MGNDEHSQNVFRKARGAGQGSARLLRRDGAGVPRRVEAPRHLVRRLHPHHRQQAALSRRCRRWRRPAWTTATSTRAPTKAGTASAARRSSRRRTSSTACVRSTRPSRSGSRRRTGSSGSRSTSSRCSKHYAEHPSFIEPEIRRNEILRLVEGGLEDISMSRAGQSWGIPRAVRSDERRLRVVRRADQLRGRRRLRLGRRAVRASGGRPTCTSSARTSRGSTA